jgi:hypothetical protein
MKPSEIIISALRGEPVRSAPRPLQNALISESLFKQANAMYRDLLAKGADSETAAAQVQRALADHLGMTHQKINDRKE